MQIIQKMRPYKFLFSFIFFYFLFFSLSAQTNSFSFQASSRAFNSIENNSPSEVYFNGQPFDIVDDDESDLITIPFSFNYLGVDFTELAVSSNGYIALGARYSNNRIMPLAGDLYLNRSQGGKLLYKTIGTGQNQSFIIEWVNFAIFGIFYPDPTYTFQIVLHPTGQFELNYGPKNDNSNYNLFQRSIVTRLTSFINDNYDQSNVSNLGTDAVYPQQPLSNNTFTPNLNFTFTPPRPTFANPGPVTICQNGSYFLDPSTTNGTWVSSDPSVATVDSKGYVSGLTPGITTISLENSGVTVSASITVESDSELSIIDPLAQAAYKINNNPQGPIGGTINYVGYNGFNYSSQTRPINSGFYKASLQSGNEAGCPYQFYIYRCSTCGIVPSYGTRPQGTLTGNTIQANGTGQLIYTSSNGEGPFMIVYQLIGGETKTVTDVSSGEPFNIGPYSSTTSYKLISVTDEDTKASTDFANTIGTISIVDPPTATLSGELTICPESTATLTLTTTGTGNITVTLSNGTVVNTTSGTTTFSVSPTINTTYTISSVIDISGAGTSNGTASVTINNSPELAVITSQPIASVTIDEGTSTTLSVTATGATGYQWYKDGNEIIDATTISYTTENTLSATGTYYVIVNGACSTTVSSTNSVVSVTALPQGTLTGSSINEGETGYLSFISSNNPVGGPFTIVYQPSGGSNITISNVTSGATISVTTGTPTRTTTYTLVSVLDENTTLSRTTGFTGATATITTFVELALSLDAGNLSSYPGNGNIWYDLSSNGINPTFITGATAPTFSPLYGGIFNFDGNQDMTLPLDDLPYGNSAFTLNAWAKATSIDGSCNFIIAYGNPTYGETRFLGSCEGNYNFGGFGGPPYDVQGSAFPLDTWVNMTGTYDGTTAILYVDGVQIATGTPNWNTVQQSGFIGKQVGGLTQRWNGSISNIQLYNRALTATEVLNNYNNSKSKFSLSNIAIGTQIWTDKNLDVTTYRNGDVIAQITNTTDWANATEGAWCYYNNDPANEAIYGKLYNMYAVKDPRGLAPQGWHIPTDAEWTTLGTFLGGDEVAGGKMKSTGTSVWDSPNTDAINNSGFTGLPGGYRYDNGTFDRIGNAGFWWSITQYNDNALYLRRLEYDNGNLKIDKNTYDMHGGFSVRLIKD
jgi:uncharacterized protein (TIGR02145 family)